jgi:hypothetical protein
MKRRKKRKMEDEYNDNTYKSAGFYEISEQACKKNYEEVHTKF